MMANGYTMMSQAEIASLKETLCAQQKLLQQLYQELEAEREASASAASEALSVILRLQGEKAAVKMEAEQYKRLAEERMGYAEESLTIIEDMITEKEMEVAELDYQVQTYRYQLMSMGFDVPGADDMHFFQRNTDAVSAETSLQHLKGKMAMLERDGSTTTDLDFISKHVEEQAGHEINDFASESERKLAADVSSHQGISCLAGQIKELQQRVKNIAGADIPEFMTESPSLSSRPSAANLSCLPDTKQLIISSSTEIGEIKHPECDSEAVPSPLPPAVHDVFEVPQVEMESTSIESPNKDKQKEVCEASDAVVSPDGAHLENHKLMSIGEPQWLKKLVQLIHHEKNSCGPSGGLEAYQEAVKLMPKDEPEWLKKLLQCTNNDNNSCESSDIAAIDGAIDQPTTSSAVSLVRPVANVDVSESSVNVVDRNSEISEVERAAEASDREEELQLLKEIKEKLNALQDEIVIQKVTNSIEREEPSLQPLEEAMVYFWL